MQRVTQWLRHGSFALVLLLPAACSPATMRQPSAGTPAAVSSSVLEARKGLIRRLYLDGYMRGNLAVIDSVYAREYLRHDSGRSATAGREDQHGLARDLRQSFPDVQMTVDYVVAEGDMVVARWTMWGTQSGAGPFGPASGKAFRFSGINTYRFENGQVVELWNHRDDLHWLQQLGLVPPAPARDPQ